MVYFSETMAHFWHFAGRILAKTRVFVEKGASNMPANSPKFGSILNYQSSLNVCDNRSTNVFVASFDAKIKHEITQAIANK